MWAATQMIEENEFPEMGELRIDDGSHESEDEEDSSGKFSLFL